MKKRKKSRRYLFHSHIAISTCGNVVQYTFIHDITVPWMACSNSFSEKTDGIRNFHSYRRGGRRRRRKGLLPGRLKKTRIWQWSRNIWPIEKVKKDIMLCLSPPMIITYTNVHTPIHITYTYIQIHIRLSTYTYTPSVYSTVNLYPL